MRHAIAFLIPAFVLAGGLAVAQDDSILMQLQRETIALSQKAAGAVVRLEGNPGAVAFHFAPRAGRTLQNGTYPGVYQSGYTLNVATGKPTTGHWFGRQAHGALVGTPPRIAVSYASVGDRAKMSAVLPDGRKVEITRAFGDEELGVAVYDLPEAERGKWKGLPVVKDWGALQRGSLVVGTGASGIVDLRTVHVADEHLGVLTLGKPTTSSVVLGASGSLAALRGDGSTPWNRTCEGCHAPQARDLFAYTTNVATAGPTLRGGRWVAGPRSGLVARSGVPGPVLARVLDDLNKHGRVRFGYLGVVLGDSGDQRGVRVSSVLENSPAATAGLKSGEWVVAINGAGVRRSSTLSRAVLLLRPGAKMKLTVLRGKEKTNVEVTLGDAATAQLNMTKPETLGFSVQEIGAELRKFLHLDPDVTGVAVQGIAKKSPAYRAGLRRGDVIYFGHNSPIADVDELYAAVAASRDRVKLQFLRDGKRLEITIEITKTRSKTR